MPGGVLPDKAEGTLMNYRMVWQVLGRVLCIEAALMILPIVTALCYGETPLPFLISAAATGLVGLMYLLRRFKWQPSVRLFIWYRGTIPPQ